jgi:hypothetical protein
MLRVGNVGQVRLGQVRHASSYTIHTIDGSTFRPIQHVSVVALLDAMAASGIPLQWASRLAFAGTR